ncbi:MAG: OsmC family protein [Bacteroidales bacterium]|nr:MAG: OsmC family protein [Bacteroidales bacterium]
MKETVNVTWLGNMAFEADIDGHKIILDAGQESGGEDKGPKPKPLMLVALAGCTGMDVVSLLKKMRVEVKNVKIIVNGDLTEEHPKHFQKMHITYEFFGSNLPVDKIQKAIDLSQERYCGVSATYRKALELTSEIKVIEG